MKRNVLIVEDNKICMETLAEIIKECDSASVTVYCAQNSAEAYKYAMEARIDLFLVDIMLDNSVANDVSGIVFVDRIREMERYQFVPVIFITALEDHKLSAFSNLHCYGYIEKPFDYVKLKELIASAMKYPVREERKKRYIYYRKDGILYSLDTEQVIYLESVRRKLVVHKSDEEVEIPYRTCSSILNELDGENFLQCNRNVIINRQYIDCVDEVNRYVRMRNGTNLEIGRILKKRFLKELAYGN